MMSSSLSKKGDRFKTAIIGAGPAGLAAAIKLLRSGVTDFVLIEREEETGGILNQCIHNGFGLNYYRDDLTGPEFARRLETELMTELGKLSKRKNESETIGPVILCSSMVSSLTKQVSKDGGNKIFSIVVHSKKYSIQSIAADTIITTTGCRERTRENIEVPGTRPAGIFTAGQAQNLINRRHYSIGRSVVIQGSGDIGLIMARRLTLEGFEVKAVFERLPYLSGSIRNKIQCLDHFGLPLYLGRQITDIRGQTRVSAVETAALDEKLDILNGTEEVFDCDTVLFAAGLIPELEAVKPAGVTLPDRFHPEVNSCFETNIPGLFTAGNCLHINDLADSAAKEGAAAAGFVVEYLKNEGVRSISFAESADKVLPYAETEANRELNTEYFTRLKRDGLEVCIVCPKGCLLSEGNYGCLRGEEYWKRTFTEASGYRQRTHTTIELVKNGLKEVIPVVSVEEIPVKMIPEVLAQLRSETKKTEVQAKLSAGSGLKLTLYGEIFTFNVCRYSKITLPENSE